MNDMTRWDLLQDEELDYLKRVGVEMHPSAMNFTRTPTWEEFSVVFTYLLGLGTRTAKLDDHVNFAIGDCINQGEEFFGEEAVDKFVKDILQLRKLRDIVLNKAGATLILLQTIEHHIKFCCTALPLKGLNLTLEDFTSSDPRRRSQTLGHVARALEKSGIFGPDFEARLSRFVSMRNEFIHSWWTEQDRRSESTGGLPPREELKETFDFIQSLVNEALYVRNVFRGLEHQLVKAHDKGTESDPILESWARHVPDFLAALKPEHGSKP